MNLFQMLYGLQQEENKLQDNSHLICTSDYVGIDYIWMFDTQVKTADRNIPNRMAECPMGCPAYLHYSIAYESLLVA